MAARACARWRRVVKAGTDSRRSLEIAVAPSSTISGWQGAVPAATRAGARSSLLPAPGPKQAGDGNGKTAAEPIGWFLPMSFRQRGPHLSWHICIAYLHAGCWSPEAGVSCCPLPWPPAGGGILGIPGWEFNLIVPSRCFWLRGGHAREELR